MKIKKNVSLCVFRVVSTRVFSTSVPNYIEIHLVGYNFFLEMQFVRMNQCDMKKRDKLVNCVFSIKILTYEYPARMFSSVVLPAPEGPMMAVSSPGLKHPLTPRRICFASI